VDANRLGVGGGVVRVGDPDLPAAGRRLAGGGEVAAEADQHAAAGGLGRAGGGAVGGQRLGGRAQVEQDPGGTRTRPRARSSRTRRHPGTVATRSSGRPARGTASKSRS
jgi:hypothetical protein